VPEVVDRDLDFVQVSDEEGKSRIKASALRSKVPKK
jgi:hypothetical protein